MEKDKPVSRIDKEHGGELVQAISKDELISMNDADCTHEKAIRLEDDGDFMVFGCANPNCNEVVLYNKS